MGQGAGLSNYIIGEQGGVEEVTLTTNQIPIHTHAPLASNTGGSDTPNNNYWADSALGKPYTAAPPAVGEIVSGSWTAGGAAVYGFPKALSAQ